jgi:hypothetical protein
MKKLGISRPTRLAEESVLPRLHESSLPES